MVLLVYKLLIAFLFILYASIGNSDQGDGLYFAAFGGVANTDLSGFGTKLAYGLRGGFKLGEKFTSGLYYEVYKTRVSDSFGGADIFIVPLLVELNFHLNKVSDGPFVGLKMGGIRHSADNVTSGFTPPINSATDFSIGVCGGYSIEAVGGHSWYTQIDSFSIDSRPHQYSFYSIVIGYLFNM